MPAPPITITPPAGPFTYAVSPTDLRGFRISVTLSQANATANWGFSAATALIDPAQVAPNDTGFNLTKTGTIPFNEAPSLAAIAPKIQAVVDGIYDQIPTP